MQTKVIIVETREAANKHEQHLYGLTETDGGDVTKIFINSRQSQGEMIDTFFHELVHAYFQWHGTSLNAKQEEKLARLVGNIVEPCFRRGVKRSKDAK